MATNLLSVSGSWSPQQTLADPVPRSGRSRSRIGNMVRREANRSQNPLSPHSNDEPLKMGRGTKQSQEQMETRDGLQDNEHWPDCKAIPFSASYQLYLVQGPTACTSDSNSPDKYLQTLKIDPWIAPPLPLFRYYVGQHHPNPTPLPSLHTNNIISLHFHAVSRLTCQPTRPRCTASSETSQPHN
jgi:hypothetical protein